CDEIDVKTIRKHINFGATVLSQMKTACRVGMGPCQGRMCDLTVAEIIADQLDIPVASLGQQRARSPIKPLTLGELANYSPSQQ
ncbi:MAG: pyridine nucleotide-disulfide oxidoreductase, partial [Rhizobiales bacterium]|nr:pyridine nucleotide-disulfide oxidoreductase [Hyphomicrobiales bacterium]